jgi:hypothetical protein
MAQHHAWVSYAESVVPDKPSAEPASLATTAFPVCPTATAPVPGPAQGGRLASSRRAARGMAP